MVKYILESSDPIDRFKAEGGGKAANLARLVKMRVNVPEWFCLSSRAFAQFVEEYKLKEKLVPTKDLKAFSAQVEELFCTLPLPADVRQELEHALNSAHFSDVFVAVRSSGLDEDSANYSFAGQFSSFLFQKGIASVENSIKKCWASAFSERGLSYRLKHGLSVNDIGVGVVVQLMVDAESAGVAFSRNPVDVLDRDNIVISSVWGLGEGLVSGELDADHFLIDRLTGKCQEHLVEKLEAFRQAPAGGVVKQPVDHEFRNSSSLTHEQINQLASLVTELEVRLGTPQDCEWGFAKGKLYCLQTRPITNLPPLSFYDKTINGMNATLWDNSNIIESYSGVTSPLTFSFASNAYRQVYLQFCEIIGVPKKQIDSYHAVFRNMLGLLRGRVYYNLINWYKLVVLLPGTTNNKSFMETMMGVREGLSPEAAALFSFVDKPPKFSFWHKLKLTWLTFYRFLTIDRIVKKFQFHFDAIYNEARRTNFRERSLPELADYYHYLDKQILHRWQAPIINDCLCMVFFGLLKKLTEKWIDVDSASSLQNDLLCGQGDLESTEPTKMLMRMAEKIDKGDGSFRQWFIESSSEQIWLALMNRELPDEITQNFNAFLEKYGFRCVNELKLEENDLHDDPTFVINAIASYVRMKAYSITEMEMREKTIRAKAEQTVNSKISGWHRKMFFWVLKHARKAIRNRENLRFDRTKIFGMVRHLFRAMGHHLARLEVLTESKDVFYLTLDELFAYIEGRSVSGQLATLAELRRKEYEAYRETPPPPDRLVTYGAVGISQRYPQVLASGDLVKASAKGSDDPALLFGTPCCPGIIEGVVRVVVQLKDAEGLNGEILVTERTDPGWVPLYPSCSGLLIERGSLLSHSAVVARELGLPTIVGITGGLMQKLKTGQRVRVDAGKGEVRILED